MDAAHRAAVERLEAAARRVRIEGGRRGGLASRRPPDFPDRDIAIRALADQGFSQRRIAAAMGCSRGAVIRALRRQKPRGEALADRDLLAVG